MRKSIFPIVLSVVGALCFQSFPLRAQPEAADHPQTLSIRKMFELADSNNRSIQASVTAEEEAKAAIKVARSAYLPTMEASLSFSYNGDGTITDRNFSNAFTAEIPAFGNNLAVQVSQVIYAGGAIKSGVKISELQSELAALYAKGSRLDVRYMLIGNYLELCKIENQLTVFDSHIAQTQKMLDDMRSRFDEGTAILNDITRYELQLQNLSYQRIQLDNTKKIMNLQLVRALGLPTGTQIRPEDGQDAGIVNEANHVNYWQDMAVGNSHTLKSALTSVQLSQYAEKLTRSGRLPKIAFLAVDRLDGPITIDIPAIDKNFNYWYVGIGIQYDFGSLWKTGRELKSKQLAVKKARQQQSVVEEKIQSAIDAAFIRYQEAYTLLETKQKSENLARQNYDVVSYRYENDLALITDLLDASSQKLDAELQVVNAKINIDFAYYTLKHISGTL